MAKERDPTRARPEEKKVGPMLVVVAPSLALEVAVEKAPDEKPELHLHPAGQGFWVARMAGRLGARVRLCTTLGGETGEVIRALVDRAELELEVIRGDQAASAYIEDHREERANQIVSTPVVPLGRHELDELFEMALAAGLSSDAVLVTGPLLPSQVRPDFYRRLVRDLRANDVFVAADLSGDALHAALESGLAFLKVADDELVEAGIADGDNPEALSEAMRRLAERGVEQMIVSRSDGPALALRADEMHAVHYPELEALEPRGTGDSIFAAIATRLAEGDEWPAAVTAGTAAGTLNVTRRGLGSAHPRDIESMAERVDLRPI
jgi:1-phosphofructokinase